ncbi:MAG: 5-formyltetrahydrofolate cyclo-ligase [Tannerella sp.]|jgi:hypothetical protein|nr:5-formyltetrahydrofolate cyclo-ligase [Tannerella sp.]
MKEKNKGNTPQSKSEEIPTAITALTAHFRPATDERDATHWLTTTEVSDAIRRLDPGAAISADKVFNAMHAAGFRYGYRPGSAGIDFRWMLHEK